MMAAYTETHLRLVPFHGADTALRQAVLSLSLYLTVACFHAAYAYVESTRAPWGFGTAISVSPNNNFYARQAPLIKALSFVVFLYELLCNMPSFVQATVPLTKALVRQYTETNKGS